MSEAGRRFLRHRLAVAGLALILLLIALALAARELAPHDPIRQDLPHALAGPSLEFPLGTDEFGRCILSRILFGARLSLLATHDTRHLWQADQVLKHPLFPK